MPTPIRSVAVVALGALIAACGPRSGGQASPSPPMRVAFFQDRSVEDHLNLVSPSFLAIETAFAETASDLDRSLEVVGIDTGGDPDEALARAEEVASDPSIVAVIAAPFWAMPQATSDVLADAGLATISLSQLSQPPSGGTSRRLVGDDAEMVSTLALLARYSGDGEACVVGDGTARSEALARALADQGSAQVRPGVRPACGAVVWTGGPAGAARTLAAIPPGARLIVVDSSKSVTLLDAALPDADGIVAVCPCADVTTSTDPEDMRFVNAYQAATGLTPGVFAAEGWDAAAILLEIAGAGTAGRATFRAALEGLSRVDGVAADYRFGPEGEPSREPVTSTVRSSGRRWIPLN